MEEKVRKTAIGIIGDVPWGTHFCQFYQTKEDLIDILVPYFKAGLENNEFCMWITSEPLNVEDAERALKKKVKDLDNYIKKGRIEILDFSQWYTRSGRFDSDQVLQGWIEKEKEALEKGFDGLRLTGNTFWLEKKEWENFKNYEAVINSVIGNYRMLAICTYCLDKCTASEIIDVVSNHQFAVIKQKDKWEIIESTEHKKTTEALRDSEARYRNIVQDQTELICRFLPDKTLTFVNGAYCQYFGKEPQELVGHKFMPFIPKGDHEGVEKHFASLSPENPVATHEHRLIMQDGETRWHEWTNRAMFDEQGNVVEFQSVGRDVTQHKKAEENVQQQNKFLNTVLESLSYPFYVIDANNYTIKLANSAGNAGQLSENPTCYRVSHKQDEPCSGVHHRCPLQEVKQTKKPVTIEHVHCDKDGNTCNVEIHAYPIFDNEGKVSQIIEYSLDITERKQAEEMLKTQKYYLERAQEIGLIGTWELDVEKNILLWTKENYCIFGIPEGTDLTYESFLECIHPEDREYINTEWMKAVDGQPYDVEHRIIADEQIKWVREKAELFFNDRNKVIRAVGVTQDITVRKQIENNLQAKNHDLSERIKELKCLYGLSKLIDKHISLEAILSGLVEIIPHAWQYPEITCCRIIALGREFKSSGFEQTDWKQSSEFFVKKQPSGSIEVFYKQQCPERDEGPFIKEERDLINALAERLGRTVERKQVENALKKAHDELEAQVKKRTKELAKSVDALQDEAKQRMDTQKALQKSEQEYRELVENANSIIMRRNVKGEITFFNEFAQKFFGYSEEEILGRNVIGTIIPKTDSAGRDLTAMVRDISKHPDQYHTNENENMRRNGERVWITWTNKPIEDKDGRVLEILAIGNDTTERRRQEKALQQSEVRLADAQRIAHIGNWDWDIVNNQLWWSDEIYRIFGLRPQEFDTTYETFLSCVHQDDREFVKQSVDKALCEYKLYSIDHRILRPDGTERTVYEQAEIIRDANKSPIRMRGTIQDVTSQKQAEEKILDDQKQLRTLTAELLLSEERERRKIARDLHDSVGQILAFSDRELGILQKSVPEKLMESVGEIRHHIKQAVKQTRTLTFDLSPPALYDIGFEAAVEELVEQFSTERKIEYYFEDCDQHKPIADHLKILLYRSIRELLTNAAKHSTAKLVRITSSRVNNDIQITVEDDGTGFDISKLEPKANNPKGFGLFSIRERLTHIGGQFDIQSGNGNGTRVTLLVPLKPKKQRKGK